MYKCIVMVPTATNDYMVLACIRSILASDYPGEILVLSNNHNVASTVCIDRRIRFVGSTPGMVDSFDTMMRLTAENTDDSYDIIVSIHNDVIVSPTWYSELMRAWAHVGIDKVWHIGMPTISHPNAPADYLSDFTTKSYGELVSKYKDIEKLCPTITAEEGQLVGLGTDFFNSGGDKLFYGIFSSCSSYTRKHYMDTLRSHPGETAFMMNMFQLEAGIQKGLWNIFANATPQIHYVSYDYRAGISMGNYFAYSYTTWFSTYHYNGDHLTTIWSGLVLAEHRDEIIYAINEKRWLDIEYIFDETMGMVRDLNCVDCIGRKICNASDKNKEQL